MRQLHLIKHKRILLWLMMWLFKNSIAQHYFPFNPAQVSYFSSSSGIFALVPNDSIVTSWPKQYRFKPTILPTNYVKPDLFTCAFTLNASLLGHHVLNYGDTLFEFYNSYHQPIRLYTQTPVGKFWLAYSDTNASVTFTHKRDSLLLNDTLQVIDIAINYHNTVFEQHEFSPILLSAKIGLVSFPTFYSFPFSLITSGSIAPKQLNLCDKSVHNITWDSIYKYQVGDELHIETTNYDPPQTLTIKTIYVIVDEAVRTSDSVCYKTIRYTSSDFYSPDSSGNSFRTDTFYLAHKRLSDLDQEPGVYAHLTLPHSQIQTPHGLGKHNYLPTTLYFPANQQDSCIFISFESASYVKDYVYINGLGGPYGEMRFNGSSTRNGRKLVFYKKGDKTWGIPFSKTVGIDVIQQHSIAQVYPNPTNGVLTILFPSIAQAKFVVYDQYGKIKYEQELEASQTEVNLNFLQAGIYYYSLTVHHTCYTKKLVVH